MAYDEDDFEFDEEYVDDEDEVGERYSYNYDENDYEYDDGSDDEEGEFENY
ncbi:hypothetical protein [Campylobacter gastrosuis]|uniref:Highly acidic protein n=1 Tax=Campylobacter gastrosuis TaxID=2974576 RepID=A0ABT7HRM5_9BACT|nr:hypothetical protein [Campylobacter gastrosuis]MDL0089283.1 hypothetical protein [Campylobacter gastrosuis]